jgi:hypothetical protein
MSETGGSAEALGRTIRRINDAGTEGLLDRDDWRRRLDAANAERGAILADLADAPPPPDPAAFRGAAAATRDLAAALAGGEPRGAAAGAGGAGRDRDDRGGRAGDQLRGGVRGAAGW